MWSWMKARSSVRLFLDVTDSILNHRQNMASCSDPVKFALFCFSAMPQFLDIQRLLLTDLS